jgi:chorismate dehydratase
MKTVIVGYLNTLPFIQGLEHFGIEMVKAHPADCAKILHEGGADVGLIPVGALIKDKSYYMLDDYGISCTGEVRTVCLFGEQPVVKWERVIMDYQSRTSVLLSKILLREKWGVNPQIVEGKKGYEKEIKGNTAGLIIGDRAFDYENKFAYKYDLGAAWKALTGLPFVFAVWVAIKPLSNTRKEQLKNALEYGIQNFHIPDAMAKLPIDVANYFEYHIEYHIGKAKQKALQSFLIKTGKQDLKFHRL